MSSGHPNRSAIALRYQPTCRPLDLEASIQLQAIKYAAMVSSMTLEQLIGAHARYIKGDDAFHRAEAAVLGHLGLDSPSDGALTGEVRTVLIAADFSREITTSVMWLNTFGLD